MSITPESAPQKDGFTFTGWIGLPTRMLYEDIVVTGDYNINIYKLTYFVDEVLYKKYAVEYGDSITPEPAPTKDGYIFSGWSDIPETMPAYDVTVKGTFRNGNKCKIPKITYECGKIVFSSQTEGVKFDSEIKVADAQKYTEDTISLAATYDICVFATKEDYEDSDTATATLCWIDQQAQTEDIADDVVQIPSRAVLIQSEKGILTIQGADDGTQIYVYDINGTHIATTISKNGLASIITSLQSGSVAIIKIGEKSIKIVIH